MKSIIPQKVQDWILGMVNGKRSVKIGHMMFATSENFKTQPFEEGLNILRTCGEVSKWLDEEGITKTERYQRLRAVKECVADAIRYEVITTFEHAEYHGD